MSRASHAEHGRRYRVILMLRGSISRILLVEITRAFLMAGVCNISDWQSEPNTNQSVLVNSQKFKHTHSQHGFLSFKEHLLLLLANRNRNRSRIR